MPIEVAVADEQSAREVDCGRWAALAEATVRAEQVGEDVELAVRFVDEETIAELNERFLGHPGPTDVLSFPIEDPLEPAPSPAALGRGRQAGGGGQSSPTAPGEPPLLLGDVVICPEVAWRNAPEHAGSYDEELALLLVHGILHLLGMDHELEVEAQAMEAREQELLARWRATPGGGAKPA
jgi:probable rRNA maturation factor